MWSTLSRIFSITVILEDTFDPPRTAVTGFSLFFKTLFKLSISLANNNPKHFSLGKNCAIIVVDACALCAVPKASFTKISPSDASSFAKATSPASSSL